MSHAFWCSRCVEQFLVMIPSGSKSGEVQHCPFCGNTDLGKVPVERDAFIATMA
jgi:hypothetical protein